MNLRLLLGRRGERAAARFLKRHRGHRIITANYRCPAGEIDLITLDKDTVVFVEVKTRTSVGPVAPFEAFGAHQQRRIENAARYFLMRAKNPHPAARFDVVSIVWPPRGAPAIEHFQDAFRPLRS